MYPFPHNRKMSPSIRRAHMGDRPAIEEIVVSAYALYVPRIGREPGPMLDDYAALIAANRVHVLDDSDVIHGILVLIPGEDSMLLDNVAFRPDSQGLGFG